MRIIGEWGGSQGGPGESGWGDEQSGQGWGDEDADSHGTRRAAMPEQASGPYVSASTAKQQAPGHKTDKLTMSASTCINQSFSLVMATTCNQVG